MLFLKKLFLPNFLRSYSNDISKVHSFIDLLVSLIVFANHGGTVKDSIIYYLIIYSCIAFCLRSLQKSLRNFSLQKIILKITVVYFMCCLFTFFVNSIFIQDFKNNIFQYVFFSSYWFYFYLLLSHFFTRLLLKNYRRKGGNTRSLLIWGEYSSAKRIFNQIKNEKSLGFNLQAWFSPNSDKENLNYSFFKGGFNEMKNWVKNNLVDSVIIASEHKDLKEVIRFFGNTNLNIYYMPVWADSTMKFTKSMVGSHKLLSIWEANDLPLELFIKRIFDFIASILLIIILSPLLLITYILLKITTNDKSFYRQERYGYNCKSFYIYKFRTMKSEDSGSSKDLKQVVKDDIRVTPLGKYLRKYSIDELPQLLNVINGDMSLVGPRPHAVAHNELYRNKINGYMQRHSIKPGMTGLAQIKGLRGETKNIKNMKDRLTADLEYIQNWSLYLDIKILAKTFFVIFKGSAF